MINRCIFHYTFYTVFTGTLTFLYASGAVDKTSSSCSAHGKIGNFIIIIISLRCLVLTQIPECGGQTDGRICRGIQRLRSYALRSAVIIGKSLLNCFCNQLQKNHITEDVNWTSTWKSIINPNHVVITMLRAFCGATQFASCVAQFWLQLGYQSINQSIRTI